MSFPRVDRYRLLSPLGHGRYGRVFLADDPFLRREVAIKLISTRDPLPPLLTRREVAALRLLDLPGVVRLLDEGCIEGEEEWSAFLVMEPVRGASFPGEVGKRWSTLRRLLVRLLQVLRTMHAVGVVHRDLKPDHVRVRLDGQPVLIDFGLACGVGVQVDRLPERLPAGSAPYMAPEQFLDAETADPSTDLYAVALMVYEVLAGHPAHPGTPAEIRRQRLRGVIPDMSALPPDLGEVLTRMLARHPADRLSTAEAVLEALGAGAAAEIDSVFAHWGEAPLSLETLRALFSGPDRLFHLQEDAADLLYARTCGEPTRTAEELTGWLQAGLVSWDSGTLRIERTTLSRLAGGLRIYQPPPLRRALPASQVRLLRWVHGCWPNSTAALLSVLLSRGEQATEADLQALAEAGLAARQPDGVWEARALPGGEAPDDLHRRIAEVLPVGTPGRLYHLIHTASASVVLAEARALAEAQGQRGQIEEALSLLEPALGLSRAVSDLDAEAALLETLCTLSLAGASPNLLHLARYELDRARVSGERLTHLGRLVGALAAAREGVTDRAQALLAQVPPLAEEALDRWRVGLAVELVQHHRGVHHLSAALDDAERWASARGTPTARADLLGWRGMIAYARGDMVAAAALGAEAAREKHHRTGRLSALFNAAAALLESGAFAQAEGLAQQLAEGAAACRLTHYEAAAAWLQRSLAYRQDLATQIDWSLVEAAAHLSGRTLRAQILITEAAISWRAGRLAAARRLAERAERSWKGRADASAVLLARAVAAACTRPPSHALLLTLAEEARCAPLPGLGLQSLGILFWAAPSLRETHQIIAEKLAADLPPSMRVGRRELMSVEEALSGIHRPPRRATAN